MKYHCSECACTKRGESGDSKESFYEDLEQVSFSKYHMKILLGDFNAKVWTENIFKPTNGN